MKSKDIRKKTTEECLGLLSEKSKKIYDVRFASSTAKLKNTKERHNLKKDIARIKTILKESQKDNK